MNVCDPLKPVTEEEQRKKYLRGEKQNIYGSECSEALPSLPSGKCRLEAM
jgi:hypothetical protein